MELIKNIGVMLGLLLTIIAIIINWKSLYFPYLKKIEEKRFEAVVKLITELNSIELQMLLASSAKTIPFQNFQEILSPVLAAMNNPFLHYKIRDNIREFNSAVISGTSLMYLILMSSKENQQQNKYDLEIHNMSIIIKKHHELYVNLMTELKIKKYEYPIKLELNENI